MNPLIRIVFALVVVFVAALESSAAATPARMVANRIDRYLSPNDSAVSVGLSGGTDEQRVGFTASAGETVLVRVSDSTYGDACGVDMALTNHAGQVVAQQPCAGANGQVVALTAAAAGTYSINLSSRGAAAGSLKLSLASTQVRPMAVPAGCVVASLPLNAASAGTWATSCASVSYAGHFSRYYHVTVPSAQVITITLSSAINPFLVLRSGTDPAGPLVATDDNSGAGLDAQIVRSLPAGTYTIEATTSAAGQVGAFSLVARTNTAPCVTPLALNVAASSQWINACTSVSYADHFSKYYTLSVPTSQVVTITLSSATDAFLVLRSGASQLGALVATDNDSGAGRDAQIVRTLAAGTYTIEATTAAANQAGSFTLTARTDTQPCFTPLSLNVTDSDQWTAQCTSVSYADHFSKYYTITVPSNQIVTVALTSSTDAFLVLRSGPSQLGPLVATDDNSGPGTNAMIARTLSAGTYTIEATTAAANQMGSFAIVARTNGAPCFTPLPTNVVSLNEWTVDCSSVSYADHYSKYYTLTVPANEVVSITLSSTIDAYLVLRSLNQLGALVAIDDNSGPGNNAEIVRTLAAGTYTIEATTSAANQLGAFALVARTNSAPCFATVGLGAVVPGTWIADCSSVSYADHYSKYYNLTVPAARSVSITLTSSVNTFLVLRSGPTQLGALVATDDNSGGGTNARIVRSLAAGTYTIEATTNAANQLGSFVLSTGP